MASGASHRCFKRPEADIEAEVSEVQCPYGRLGYRPTALLTKTDDPDIKTAFFFVGTLYYPPSFVASSLLGSYILFNIAKLVSKLRVVFSHNLQRFLSSVTLCRSDIYSLYL
jgi:hypothetical protein